MTKDEAMKLALEALKNFEKAGLATLKTIDAITAIKQALEQPEPEPVAWTDEDFTELIVSEDIAKDIGATIPLYTSPPETAALLREIAVLSANALDDYKMIQSLMAEREPEPVAVVSGYYGGKCVVLPTDRARIFNSGTAFYTHPPKREPEPEPVIDKSAAIRIATSLGWTPKREWQGLTDEERSELLDKYYFDDPSDAFMKEFEAKLKEKNT